VPGQTAGVIDDLDRAYAADTDGAEIVKPTRSAALAICRWRWLLS